MNRTKIVATIGPASRDRATLEALVAAGMSVARLNFSHGTQAEHAEVIDRVRAISEAAGRPVAVLQDLAGPKIRTGPMAAEGVVLEVGQKFTLTARDVPGDANEVGLTWDGLVKNVVADDVLLLADGALRLRVDRVRGDDVVCRVEVGGPLTAHKGINLPDRTIDVPILSDKDRADLAFGLAQGVDLVAVSFVRSAADMKTVRALCAELGKPFMPLVAKIEKHEALENIDEILDHTDAIMVARGDLGVEIPIEQVPRAQKRLIRKANAAGRPVITATQMLMSMVTAPRPTRAEVTDVANAILDGTDAVMLSEETTIGQHPVLTVETMARIAADAESVFPHDDWLRKVPCCASDNLNDAVALSAVELAADIGAAAIIICTVSGGTARMVIKRRPKPVLVAVTPDEATQRVLTVGWGLHPILSNAPHDDFQAIEADAIERARAAGLVRTGDSVVLTAGLPFSVRGTTNLIKVAVVS